MGCRVRRTQEWAGRCQHEAQMHEQNCFITLTYHDRYLPKNNSLDHRDFQLFMKSLRKKLSPKKIRYFMCGEYGEELGRAHFHALIFGYDFPEQYLWKRNKKGQPINRSPQLDFIWGNGIATVQELNYETAAYTASYTLKKITGDKAQKHYETIDQDTGEVINRTPEYARMSTGGELKGIGNAWLSRYAISDVHYSDNIPVIRKGKFGVQKTPRYYDKVMYKDRPEDLAKLKRARIEKAEQYAQDNTPERLAQIDECYRAKFRLNKRKAL